VFDRIVAAIPLLITGFFKKLVIADNVSPYVDEVFGLAHTPFVLLVAGAFAFTIQIYADFSAYTDIARGSARLLGFELIKNFNAPYAALTPADFWRRWHISFSTWIRDYLYIPLGGSRNLSTWRQFYVLLVTFGLSGLWHGAAWNFVFWGIYHALLLFVYRHWGKGARYTPSAKVGRITSVAVMFLLILFGWTLFRASSMTWLMTALFSDFNLGISSDYTLISTFYIVTWTLLFALPLLVIRKANKWPVSIQGAIYGIAVLMILLFVRDSAQDFIYFQF
jgi:D-alanyl-lipoteichoic acid acyltransferase DltB (MBOAT superfamily)